MGSDHEELPRASPAAWSPDAAPKSQLLNIADFEAFVAQHEADAAPEANAAPHAEPAPAGTGTPAPSAPETAADPHPGAGAEAPAAPNPYFPAEPEQEAPAAAEPPLSAEPEAFDTPSPYFAPDPEPEIPATPDFRFEPEPEVPVAPDSSFAPEPEPEPEAEAEAEAPAAPESPVAPEPEPELPAAFEPGFRTDTPPPASNEPPSAGPPVGSSAPEPDDPLPALSDPAPTAEADPAPSGAAGGTEEIDLASSINFVLPPAYEPKPMPGLDDNFDSLTGIRPEIEPRPDAPEEDPAPEAPPEVEWRLDTQAPPEPAAEPEAEAEAEAEPEPEPPIQPEPEPVVAAPPADPPPPVQAPEAERPDHLAALRDMARRLRTAPDSQSTLQYVIELACRCTGSHAGMLTVTVPENRQVVWGTALGAGPYISVQLRAGGPSFGEIVLTRMADATEFESRDETFAELVAEYVAKAVGALRRGTVLSEEQQDFIDRVTEELRSPLAGVVNLLDTVLAGQASAEESAAYVRRTAEDTRRMLRLVDDLLHIARLRPPEPREMEAIPAGPWLRRAVEAARPAAEAAGHTLNYTESGAGHVIRGVPEQLDVVLHHVLDNAVKFSEEPGPIDVTVAPAEGLLQICVADHGIGFDAADASRMLDCFARAINAEAARIPGTGIGLFLASEIVRGHGGRLWLESRRDEGTQAYVAIPFDG